MWRVTEAGKIRIPTAANKYISRAVQARSAARLHLCGIMGTLRGRELRLLCNRIVPEGLSH